MCQKYCIERRLPFNRRTSAAIGTKGKYWKTGDTLEIRFMSGEASEHDWVMDIIQKRIAPHVNLNFQQVNVGGDIRIGLVQGAGSWSYIGTDAAHIPGDLPTMNIGWKNDPGTVIHEALHALGMMHEHQHPLNPIRWNREVVIQSLMSPPNNWTMADIAHNVFDVPRIEDVDALPEIDLKSIMMYYFPQSWTLDNMQTTINQELSPKDIAFLGQLYPFAAEPETVIVNTEEANIALKALRYLLNNDKRGMRNTEKDLLQIQKILGITGGDKKLRKSDNLKLIQKELAKVGRTIRKRVKR